MLLLLLATSPHAVRAAVLRLAWPQAVAAAAEVGIGVGIHGRWMNARSAAGLRGEEENV